MKKTAIILGAVLGFGAAVWAGEGIPVGNAVLYPSVEGVYTHTDNMFMADSSMPFGNVADSYWIIRPTLGIEIPLEQSSVRMDFGYQYKDYDSYDLSVHNTYFFDFKGLFKFSNGFALTVDNHFIRGVQEVKEFDPGYEHTFGNSPFDHDNLKVGLEMPLTRANTLGVYGVYNVVRFTGDAYDTRPFYDYTQSGGGLTWRYAIGPASSWVFDGEYLTSKPRENRQDILLLASLQKKYNQTKLMTGWEGFYGKALSGFAKVGYTKMSFTENANSDFSGFSADVGLGFQPAEALKVDLTLGRHPYQSAYNVNNFYTATSGQLQIHQQVSRYFFWTAGYRYQENAYPDRVDPDVYDTGSLLTGEVSRTAGQLRKDKITRLYGEVGYHFNRQFSLRANYQYEDRNSSINYDDSIGILRRPFSYKENRFSLQGVIGW